MELGENCIFVTANHDYLSVAEIDLHKSLKLSLEDLKKGKLAIFEGILHLEPVKQSPNDEVSQEQVTEKSKSESTLNQPHIGVRFSVGLHPDAGLTLEPIKGNID